MNNNKAVFRTKAKILITVFFIIAPLVFALFVYLQSNSPILITAPFRCFLDSSFKYSDCNFPSFIRNYFCDACWAFSFECCLFLIFNKSLKNLFASSIIASCVGICLEFFQKTNLFSGTYDSLDIIFEIAAIILAEIILYFIWEANYEKKR